MKEKINYLLFFIAIGCVIAILKLWCGGVIDNNKLLYDTSMGILLALIIYFIVDYIPEKRKKRMGFKLIQAELSKVIANIETILSINRDFFSIDKELDEIVLRDWKVMFNKRDTTSYQFIMYERSFKNKKCKVSNNYYIPDPVMQPSNLNEVVRSSLRNIEASLNVIFSYESYFVNDTRFFEYLTKLKNSKLIELYTDKYDFNYMSNTYEYIYELQKIYFAVKNTNIHYYERKSIIDNSEKAIEYQKKYNSGGTLNSFLSFQERKKGVMSSTTRIIYFKKYGYYDFISKDISSHFQTELCEYKNINEVKLSSDLDIVITDVFSAIYLSLKYRNKENLGFFIIQARFIGLLIRFSKIFKVNKNITICIIPISFNLLGKNINKEDPSVRSIGIITQEIDKQFNDQHRLHIK
ncbi:hypothetical protein AQ616_09970 [Oceanobacillus sp. E9]|uniref:hypothetical protein n=1 Tax=Oceanobacillus sp. E9 TaxID=1742575 RepID=UPI00084EA562|nr:hypothetical protein [Oceanobacillus sp. E9]OEH54084.1 hypothetical protein AQ616_09970 [Oceanobacillus sp. E9]